MTRTYRFTVALGALALSFSLWVGSAHAKQVVDYFGTDPLLGTGQLGGEFDRPHGIAINQSGAGPAERGDIYVVDRGPFSTILGGDPEKAIRPNRIQRFGRDDNGTPLEPYDDSYFFISAWGADVVQAGGAGDKGDAADANYEICTVATQCKFGVAAGGNGTPAGNGTFNWPRSVAIDQDTGDVYVSDGANRRINVYQGDGIFLRSFGYDVVDFGPSLVAAPNEIQNLIVDANGGKFSIAFRGRATGPRGIGGWQKGSSTLTGLVTTEGAFAVGQSISGSGLAPDTTIVAVSGNTLTLSQPATGSVGPKTPLFGDDLAHDAPAAEVEAALNALPSIGGVGGSVSVSGGPGDEGGSAPYVIEFGGSLAGDDVPMLLPTSGGLMLGAGTGSATATEAETGGAFESCVAAAGDVCTFGNAGAGTGQIGVAEHTNSLGIAVSVPDGDSEDGTVYLADSGNRRVSTYTLSGSFSASFGSASLFEPEEPKEVEVDSRGIVYASNSINSFQIERYDTEGVNGAVGFMDPIGSPPLASKTRTRGLAVDPDSDGPGPDSDVLFVLRSESVGSIQQFGPLNAPGLLVPPGAADEEHGADQVGSGVDIAIDQLDGRQYMTAAGAAGQDGNGVYVLDEAGAAPTASLESLADETTSSVTANAIVDPNGPPLMSYRFEYSLDGSTWTPLPSVVLGTQDNPQPISEVLSPPLGFEPKTTYHIRLVATKKFMEPVTTSALTFMTDPAPPLAETVGAPHRTTTTAQIGGRVAPRNDATTYRFEYGDQGPCGANPCTATVPRSAGSHGIVLVAHELTGLTPDTTYHYRVIADNGNSGSPVGGADMTFTTRASEAQLDHGNLPGPPGSDRAYEMVSLPDAGGNPVRTSLGFSDDGERAIYGIAGGTPIGDTGAFGLYYAERGSSSWQTRQITPPRAELDASSWNEIAGRDDLAVLTGVNASISDPGYSIWRLEPDGVNTELSQIEGSEADFKATSDSGSRTVQVLEGSADPEHPASGANLYDISVGTPRLISLMPGGGVPACGVGSDLGAAKLPNFITDRESRWVSADGAFAFFPSRGSDCGGVSQLYARDFGASQTRLLSGPALSGPDCSDAFLTSTPGAAFFWTQTRLDPVDTVAAKCGVGNEASDGDIYRYDIESDTLKCITCIAEADADVVIDAAGAEDSIAVADDGSRIYFQSAEPLVPGASDTEPNTYRVDVSSGNLVWVGSGIEIGTGGAMLSPDGSVVVFRSDSASLNPLGGLLDNGGMAQYYRYDDRDRSLVCVSCPLDGSTPQESVVAIAAISPGPNLSMVADNGDVAFATPTPLTSIDQNTPGPGGQPVSGTDVYEWRDGRHLLVTDGLTSWPASQAVTPAVQGISPSGKDVFFTAAAQYTPDALDGYQRLYTARIGGGFEFAESPQPCALEVCQGTPKGAPDDPQPASSSFSGHGNIAESFGRKPSKCRKGKRKTLRAGKVRCLKPRKRARGRTRTAKRAYHGGRAEQ